MRDILYSIFALFASLAPAARTASANGTGVDLANSDNATAVIQTGTVTDGTHTIAIQESDDNVTFTNVAASDLIGAAPVINAAASNQVFKVGYNGIKRYIRVIVTVAGATTGGVYGAVVIVGGRRKQP